MKESELKISIPELENYFLNEKDVFSYGSTITVKYTWAKPFSRLGSHIMYVEREITKQAIEYGRYNKEIAVYQHDILSKEKIIEGKIYCELIDHKNDQTREVMDYIISKNINTTIYVFAPDNLFWFFHDMGHGFLADLVDNFYENVYGRGEMLVNIFAAIKLKQAGYFNRENIISEVVEKGYRYHPDAKKYFCALLEKIAYSDDVEKYA